MQTSNQHSSLSIELPLGLMSDTPWFKNVTKETALDFLIPANYDSLIQGALDRSEVLGIQRLLTLAHHSSQINVYWDENIIQRVRSSASIYPLLAVLLLLKNATHFIKSSATDLPNIAVSLKSARKLILQHRLKRDLFSDSDILICDDAAGETLPIDLYDSKTQQLLPREDLETLIEDVLTAQLGSSVKRKEINSRANALGVIFSELFENTDMHGRLDLMKKPLQYDNLRGIVLKRIKVKIPETKKISDAENSRVVDCFEISVFDAGLGYFASYMRQNFDSTIDLNLEWRVLHNCLERHYHPELVDHRASHRAMGLYEVLRALQTLKGYIEIRTGRLFAQRTFFEGALQPQMESLSEFSRFAWPKPKLLDVAKRYVAIPSEHEFLLGSSIRIIIPLW
jgi:hypothetical protein